MSDLRLRSRAHLMDAMEREGRRPTTVFTNGVVFTADAARSWATAVAVADGRIAAVGGDAEVAAYVLTADEVVDLEGRVLLPGFIDAHVHPIQGGLERSRCDLTSAADSDEYAATVSAYTETHPNRPWVLGGGWSMDAFPGGRPSKEALDVVAGGRPVFLPNRDHHSAWVSSAALELAGVNRDTGDPPDGRIERDDRGDPTGLLHEGAMDLVGDIVPPDTQSDIDGGLRVGQAYLHSLGVVGWQDAWVLFDEDTSLHHAYLRAQEEGWLTARVMGALWWDRSCPQSGVAEQVDRMARARDEARAGGGRYAAEYVKVMQDGVVETFTAAMLEPYLDGAGQPTTNTGLSFLDRDLVREVTVALDRAGFGVHFHAIGDRAVREALDAVEQARTRNGSSDLRHHIAHLQVVHPSDLPRFRRLRVTANLQALWACHEPQMDDFTIPFLGTERSGWQYPFGDLHRDGVTIAMGSDWPVSTPDPLAAIHTAVNRAAPESGPDAEPLGAEQALPLAVAVAAYTSGSAFVNRVDDRSGTIRAGYDADLVVLDRNPFEGPASEIADARVVRTYVAGEAVYVAD